MSRSPLAQAAGEYLSRGLAVIALTGKTPNVKVHRHGLHDHLTGAPESPEDWALVERAFDHADTTGVGILTSYPYVVVDIDGEDGAKQWMDLTGELLDQTDRWVASTGRGLHLWFATTTHTGTIKLGPQLDLKGDGGYVAAPPSVHPSGAIYEWLLPPGDDAPLEVPEPLRRIIEDRAYDLKQRIASKVLFKQRFGPAFKEGDTVFYAQANHDALIAGMATAEEGNRNNYLHWAAATLAEENGSEEEFEQLEAIALKVGLDNVEVRRTLRSARRSHD